MSTRESVYATVEKVLRQDLRLGQVPISETTRLVGGELPLDSLDLLMVVTGTEKALGIKLPSQRLGRTTMETVGDFVTLVCDELTTAGRSV